MNLSTRDLNIRLEQSYKEKGNWDQYQSMKRFNRDIYKQHRVTMEPTNIEGWEKVEIFLDHKERLFALAHDDSGKKTMFVRKEIYHVGYFSEICVKNMNTDQEATFHKKLYSMKVHDITAVGEKRIGIW